MSPTFIDLLRLIAEAIIDEVIGGLHKESKSIDGLIEDVLSKKKRGQSL